MKLVVLLVLLGFCQGFTKLVPQCLPELCTKVNYYPKKFIEHFLEEKQIEGKVFMGIWEEKKRFEAKLRDSRPSNSFWKNVCKTQVYTVKPLAAQHESSLKNFIVQGRNFSQTVTYELCKQKNGESWKEQSCRQHYVLVGLWGVNQTTGLMEFGKYKMPSTCIRMRKKFL